MAGPGEPLGVRTVARVMHDHTVLRPAAEQRSACKTVVRQNGPATRTLSDNGRALCQAQQTSTGRDKTTRCGRLLVQFSLPLVPAGPQVHRLGPFRETLVTVKW
jgi:hypothetical protein